MKQLLLLLLLISLIIFRILIFAGHHHHGQSGPHKNILPGLGDSIESSAIRQRAHLLQEVALTRHCNQRIFFLADMQLPSGKNRFFIFDLSKDSIISASLVAHGHGNSGFSFSPVFSNSPGSSCTALGKYRVGKICRGSFGAAYKLLDLTAQTTMQLSEILYCTPMTVFLTGNPIPIPFVTAAAVSWSLRLFFP